MQWKYKIKSFPRINIRLNLLLEYSGNIELNLLLEYSGNMRLKNNKKAEKGQDSQYNGPSLSDSQQYPYNHFLRNNRGIIIGFLSKKVFNSDNSLLKKI